MNTTIERSLPCPVPEDELHELSEQLGKDCVRKARVEEEKKSSNKAFNDKIAFMQEEIDKAATVVATGEKLRTVKVSVTKNPLTKMMEYVRCDTHEIIEERPLTEEELAEILMDFPEDEQAEAHEPLQIEPSEEEEIPDAVVVEEWADLDETPEE